MCSVTPVWTSGVGMGFFALYKVFSLGVLSGHRPLNNVHLAGHLPILHIFNGT